MVKQIWYFQLLIFALFFHGLCVYSGSVHPTEPQLLRSFKIKPKQNAGVTSICSYTLTIKTSCASPSRTRDRISLAFGDSYGNEVYAARLDDPSYGIFERCSTDTFRIQGPCTYDICYLYLLRVGSDGWKPESVKVYGADRRTLTFNFNTFLPNGVWFGFNHCGGGSRKAGAGVVV